jgi:hypothetical protein
VLHEWPDGADVRRLAAAVRAFLETLGGAPYFDWESDERMTPEQWAALMILHAEAVHDCEHTDQARAELGIVGPRGERAEVVS